MTQIHDLCRNARQCARTVVAWRTYLSRSVHGSQSDWIMLTTTMQTAKQYAKRSLTCKTRLCVHQQDKDKKTFRKAIHFLPKRRTDLLHTSTLSQPSAPKRANTKRKLETNKTVHSCCSPKSKISSSSSIWSMTSSKAASIEAASSGAMSSSAASRSTTLLALFNSMLHALHAFKAFLSTDFSRSRLMATRASCREAALRKQLGSGRDSAKRLRTLWRLPSRVGVQLEVSWRSNPAKPAPSGPPPQSLVAKADPSGFWTYHTIFSLPRWDSLPQRCRSSLTPFFL